MTPERLAERAPWPILVIDRDGVLRWANAAAAPILRAWRVTPGGAIPRTDADRIATAATRRQELEVDLVLGERPWTLVLSPQPDGAVVVWGTDRSRLAAAEERLLVADRAPALSPDPILRIDDVGRLTWANAAAAPIFRHWSLHPGDSLPADWAAAAEAARTERRHDEVIHEGARTWAVRLVADMDGSGVYAYARDASRDQPEPEGPRDSFVANMGHELRTPLNAITGYAELLHDELQDRGLDTAVADLGRIRQSAAVLRALIDDIVDLAKLQAGRVKVQVQPFYVSDLVDDVLAQVSSRAEANRNAIHADVRVDPEELRADPNRVRQVLIALLDNAAKFTQDGEIRVEVRDADGPDGAPAVAFRVHDTGIGLEAEQLAGLFRAYAQGDGSATRKYGGTGLGLAIARMLARRMGGDIHVRSERGKGSTFTLLLPRDPGSE